MTVWFAILGFLLGSGLMLGLCQWRLSHARRQYQRDHQIQQQRIADKDWSLRLMLDIMLHSAQNQQGRLRSTINTLISDTTDLAQDNAQALSEMAQALGNSKQLLTEVTDQIQQVVTIAEEGQSVSSTVKTVIDEFRETAQQLGQIQEQMQQVQDKANAINSVGQEAEMLALNAAIEAARAGEAGRGFAVVADSMKSLAKSSQTISAEVQTVLNDSSQGINRASQSVESKSHQVIDASDTLIKAFANLNALLGHFIERVQQLDHAFAATQSFVDDQTQQARTRTESAIRGITLEANQILGMEIRDLTPQQAAGELDRFDALIDVRRPEEFNDELGHIDGAELSTLQTDLPQRLAQLDPNHRYLFICRSGGRSTKAAQQALLKGFREVYNLDGGMIAWRKAGY
ncbi:MAG: methyl-accepting chemotaxis protein [Saccharospirillum sp.]